MNEWRIEFEGGSRIDCIGRLPIVGYSLSLFHLLMRCVNLMLVGPRISFDAASNFHLTRRGRRVTRGPEKAPGERQPSPSHITKVRSIYLPNLDSALLPFLNNKAASVSLVCGLASSVPSRCRSLALRNCINDDELTWGKAAWNEQYDTKG